MRLRCQGDLNEIVSHQYFIDNSPQNEEKFYYCMSGKALFYFMLKCCPKVEKVMMSRYLENPLNTMMFVEYDQSQEGFTSKDVGELKRIMHLDHAFLKYTKKVDCNLICIGEPGCLKSTLLNEVFGFKFE